MREREQIALQESQATTNGNQDGSDVEQTVFDAEQAGSRQIESQRTKLFVLIGSGILQLPIWGTFGDILD